MVGIPELNAVVTQKDELTPRLMILRVEPDGWESPSFEAGQYVLLGLPPTVKRCVLSVEEETQPRPDHLLRRAYSIASSSLNGEYMDFYIRLVSTGALTPRLFTLGVGDRLWMSGNPKGLFTLADVPPDRDVILVATGTGLAPYMSMLGAYLECGGSRRILVLHGATHSWDLGYRSELEALQHLCSNFSYIPTIDRPDDEPVQWHGRTGRVQQLWQSGDIDEAWGRTPSPEDTDVFLCGVPGMIDDMVAVLTTESFIEHTRTVPGQIHVERF
ncbi:Ferredoxin--NADP(+) reductase [hydrothermal vent metagenome]|uniref:ferredoxin--NADP(+) reductase n=1 Tax=hydrothermal vent metagenome TaxID=652676 RepID=A0A3B0SWY3_9ZZZZ